MSEPTPAPPPTAPQKQPMSTGRLVVLILLIVFLSIVTIAVATFIFLAGTIVDEEDGTATAIPTSEVEYQDQTRVNN